ncbi:MAG: lipid-A-disaccharide synthase [Rhizobiaceae bacterium]|nr:MAG: lipid-A-disaccharide synthase [Rhizobiaceae bacterium]
MRMEKRPLRIAVVAGEESGDLLGADLVQSLAVRSGRTIELFGVGGRHLEARGLHSLFDQSQIAIMGVTAVVRDLPRIVYRIGATARAIARWKPDCLVTIDVPGFTLPLARKVRRADPSIPIVHYVCPSVWAWRAGRAPAMQPNIDRVLCLLPFEPEALVRLKGPPGTFVGHRLARDPAIIEAAEKQRQRAKSRRPEAMTTLLLLPGSRRSEIRSLIGPFGETVTLLKERGNRLRLLLPTVPHLAGLVSSLTASWPEKPEIIHDAERKWQAFAEADAALAASGTVSLELALARVPFVACYKTDRVMKLFRHLITIWSSQLPNLIADYVIVPEYIDFFVRPGMLARQMEQLAADTPQRAAQLAGFDDVLSALAADRPSGEMAAEIVLAEIAKRQET